MDDGRAFPSGLSFLSLLSFFLPCSSLFHTRLVSASSVFCPVVLPLPSSFPSFFFPYIQEFPGEIENIGTEIATRFLRSFPTGASTGIVDLYTGSKSHKTVRDTTLLRVRFIHDAVPCVA